MRVVWLLVITILISACGKQAPYQEPGPTVVSTVSQVLMNEPDSFTFLVDLEDSQVGQLHLYLGMPKNKVPIKIFRDLKADQQISISYLCGENETCQPLPKNFSLWRVNANHLVIHLHSDDEINGAGWNHGKYGKGQTEVIR